MHRIFKAIRSLRWDRRGNVTLIAALAMPVVFGSLGLGAEVASWYGGKRSLQSAADSAAIAAATNASANYAGEARAVAAQYGLRNGVDGITVTALNNQPCPAGGNNCYKVTITKAQPLLLAQVVGFEGDVQVNGAPAKLIKAKAVAFKANTPREYCLLALAGSGYVQAIRGNGSPSANLTGCHIMSNTEARCPGHGLGADIGDANGDTSDCATQNHTKVPKVTDPYAALAANIPASDPCGGVYKKAPSKKSDPPLPSANLLHGLDGRSVINICGDAELSGPTFISAGGTGTILYIWNGGLDLQGNTLMTQDGSSLTIIYAGSDNSRSHAPKGAGMFDIKAPSTGPWKGVAMYQKPTLTGGVDVSEAGNTPAWKITGLVYMPKASVTFSGVVNKASYGKSCFGMVVDHILINGTAQIAARGECPAAGLVLPQSLQPGRGQLVS